MAHVVIHLLGARAIWLEGDIVRPQAEIIFLVIIVIVSKVYFCYRWPSEGEKNAICPLQEIFLNEKTPRLAIVWPGTKI